MFRPSVFFGSMPLMANCSARSGCSLRSLPSGYRLEIPQVPGVVVIHLVVQLVAGDRNLPGVQHHDMIAHVDVRAVVGLVLALEAVRNLRGEAPERLAAGVDHIPVTAHGGRIGEYRLHDACNNSNPKAPCGLTNPQDATVFFRKNGRGSVLKPPPLCKAPVGGPDLGGAATLMLSIIGPWNGLQAPVLTADTLLQAADNALRALFAPAQANRSPARPPGLQPLGGSRPAPRGRADAGQPCRRDRRPGALPRPGPHGPHSARPANSCCRRPPRKATTWPGASSGSAELGARTSLLNPLWYAGSFAIGAAAAALSDRLEPGLRRRDRTPGRRPPGGPPRTPARLATCAAAHSRNDAERRGRTCATRRSRRGAANLPAGRAPGHASDLEADDRALAYWI